MFTHYFVGCMVFFAFGNMFGWNTTSLYLIVGSVMGALPDLLSLIISKSRINKWSHLHRDNFTHSVFLSISVFCLVIFFDFKVAIVVGTTLLTHPILDSFGIGWGVKLFYPLSDLQIKLFHKKGKVAYTQQEIDSEVEKFGNENWFHDLFLTFNSTAIIEWGSLLANILVIILN